MTQSTEIATASQPLGVGIPADTDLTRLDYSSLIESGEFYQIPGFGLVSDKDQLIGVPHAIIGVTFQMPVKDKAAPAGERDYVTLRAIVADQAHLDEAVERRWIPAGKPPFKPGELICYNDGSTGIRRDVVKILQNFGLIEVGHEDEPNRFDLPWTMWNSFSQFAEQGENTVPEFSTNHQGNLFVLKVGRGLRKSEYSNDYAENAVTYYL